MKDKTGEIHIGPEREVCKFMNILAGVEKNKENNEYRYTVYLD